MAHPLHEGDGLAKRLRSDADGRSDSSRGLRSDADDRSGPFRGLGSDPDDRRRRSREKSLITLGLALGL